MLSSAPHWLPWPKLIALAVVRVSASAAVCAVAMFLSYVVFPPQPEVGAVIRRTSAVAACFAPLVMLLQYRSIWSVVVAVLIVWSILPAGAAVKEPWKKFLAAFVAAVLLQVGIAARVGNESIVSTLVLGLASAPILWRIRQERDVRSGLRPRNTILVALVLTILGMIRFGSGYLGGSATGAADTAAAPPGISKGGKWRGVILIPVAEQRAFFVPPVQVLNRSAFPLQQDPEGIPFYGVYWLFQRPDTGPTDDAHRVQGTPDQETFHSADRTPLMMEARQNLGRLIDLRSYSRIDVVVRNADSYAGLISLQMVVVNTSLPIHRQQWLGQASLTTRPPAKETLSFKIPPVPVIEQFDELVIRFQRAPTAASRSAKIAIERFFLVPRG